MVGKQKAQRQYNSGESSLQTYRISAEIGQQYNSGSNTVLENMSGLAKRDTVFGMATAR